MTGAVRPPTAGRPTWSVLLACAAAAACQARAPSDPAPPDAAPSHEPFVARDLGTGNLVRLALAPPRPPAGPHGVLILRREDGWPAGPRDGRATTVYRGPFRAVLFDTQVTPQRTYHYAAYLLDRAPRDAPGLTARVYVGVRPVADLTVTDPGLGGRLELSWREPESGPVDYVRILRFAGACADEPEAAGFERRIDLPAGRPGQARRWLDDDVPDGTDHCYAVFVRSGVHYSPGASALGRASDATPPAAVSGLAAAPSLTPGDPAIELSWTDPADSDLARVLVLRRTDAFPHAPDDAEARVVCDGPAAGCRDRFVEDGVEYRYRAWAFDEVPLTSRPSDATARRPFLDDDADGFREDQGDCNDADGRVRPGAVSLDCSATDWDCDGAGWDDAFCTRTAPASLDAQCAAPQPSYPCVEGLGCRWYLRPDHSPCTVVTEPDTSYDICSGGACRSPGSCGSAACNSPGPHHPPPPAVGQAAFARTGGREPVVLDRVGGRMWQGCPAGLAGRDCSAGRARSETRADGLAYCDGLVWAGFDDWRLPDHYELLSLVDYGRVRPAVDPALFPATAEFFWSSSSYASGSAVAWVVHYAAGHQSYTSWDERHQVRCVRNTLPGPVADAEGWTRFRRRADPPAEPVVLDAVTGRAWQGCAAGLGGPDCATGTARVDTWERAVAYCEALAWGGFEDWRLPDVKELAGIVDTRVRSPALDVAAFPATPVGWYWSGLPWVLDPLAAWQVNFSSGHVGTADKALVCHVRCVRDEPSAAGTGRP